MWHPILIGAGLAALSKIASNLYYGRQWTDGVLAAAAGGAVFTAMLPAKITAAAIVGVSKAIISASAIESAGRQFERAYDYDPTSLSLSKTGAGFNGKQFWLDTVSLATAYGMASVAGSLASEVLPIIAVKVFIEVPVSGVMEDHMHNTFGSSSSSSRSYSLIGSSTIISHRQPTMMM